MDGYGRKGLGNSNPDPCSIWFCPGNMREDVNEIVEVSGVGVEDGVLGGVGLPPCPKQIRNMIKRAINNEFLVTECPSLNTFGFA
jgi:hypothetical protein